MGTKVGETWKTYVLVNSNDPDCWYTMNVNLDEIKKRHEANPDTIIEVWWYHRGERLGDKLIKREPLK